MFPDVPRPACFLPRCAPPRRFRGGIRTVEFLATGTIAAVGCLGSIELGPAHMGGPSGGAREEMAGAWSPLG